MSEKCGKDQVIDFNKKRLITNLWGIGRNETIPFDKNCIFVNSDNTHGWRWDRPSPAPQTGKTTSPIAPSACIGTDPWGGFSTSEYLPIRIRDIDSLKLYVEYNYSVMPSPDDSQNLSYDLWITESGNPNPNTPRQELMIWLNRLSVPMPEDKLREDVSDGYNTYRQYAWENYHAFILDVLPQPGLKTHTVDVKKLLEYILNKGELKKEQWLALIAFESEVWKGAGELTVNNMDAYLNGTWVSCPAVMYDNV